MYFYNQIIPKKLNPKVADAVKHICPIRGYNVFDAEAYHPNGKIISILRNTFKFVNIPSSNTHSSPPQSHSPQSYK